MCVCNNFSLCKKPTSNTKSYSNENKTAHVRQTVLNVHVKRIEYQITKLPDKWFQMKVFQTVHPTSLFSLFSQKKTFETTPCSKFHKWLNVMFLIMTHDVSIFSRPFFYMQFPYFRQSFYVTSILRRTMSLFHYLELRKAKKELLLTYLVICFRSEDSKIN